MGKKTPFYAIHCQENAKIVDFAGWDMPLHYGSQLQEHHDVRQHAGMFDVSHMGVVDLDGSDAAHYLRYLLANNIDRIQPGRAIYTCMLNEQGGVLDDLIVYKISENNFRLVINAGTREKDLAWMRQQAAGYNIKLVERTDLAMLAVQGPAANAIIAARHQGVEALKPFSFVVDGDYFIARTGYTGEDGVEIILPAANAEKVWQTLREAGVKPCGLGARDTLRLEAGLNLYGSDMDETVTPLESNLAWTVALDPKERDFIGRKALEKQQAEGVQHRLVGLVLKGQGIIRNHQKVSVIGNGQGEVTSGGYSPTLAVSIALARLPNGTSHQCQVEIRQKQVPACVIKLPFVKHGKKCFEEME